MDLIQLKYFVTTATTETMRQASDILHVSQSALSMSIKNLETELGVYLFVRDGRRLALTSIGHSFLDGAVNLLRDAEALKSSVMNKNVHTRTLFLAADAVDFAMESTYAFRYLHPDIAIQSCRPEEGDIIPLLLSSQADLAVSLYPVEDPNIETTLLFNEPMDLLVSDKSPFAARDCVSMTELGSETLITVKRGQSLQRLLESFFTAAGIRPAAILEVGDPEVLIIQAEKQSGITFLPRCLNHTRNTGKGHSFAVQSIPVQELFCCRSVYVSHLKSLPEKPELQQFIRFLPVFREKIAERHRYPLADEYASLFSDTK